MYRAFCKVMSSLLTTNIFLFLTNVYQGAVIPENVPFTSVTREVAADALNLIK